MNKETQPSEEWIDKMADLEDKSESISVGGMAHDMGMLDPHPTPWRTRRVEEDGKDQTLIIDHNDNVVVYIPNDDMALANQIVNANNYQHCMYAPNPYSPRS